MPDSQLFTDGFRGGSRIFLQGGGGGGVNDGRGGGTNKKVGGLTLPLNDCTEAGVQGLHSEEFLFPLASEKVVGLSPPTPQSGGAKAPSAPPGSATPERRYVSRVDKHQIKVHSVHRIFRAILFVLFFLL